MTDLDPALKILDAFSAACSFMAAVVTLMLTAHYARQWDWREVTAWER